MYDETIKHIARNNLEKKAISICNTIVALSSQGYIANKMKEIKLEWSSILLHAYDNIDVLNDKQQQNIEVLYNKIYNI